LLIAAACTPEGPLGLPESPECPDLVPLTSSILHTEHRDLLDESDRLVLLRGINAGGRSKFAPYSPFDYEEGHYDEALDRYLDLTQSWGINVLRVPFSWAAAQPTPETWDEEYLSRYDALLDGAWERGMWTIVDFHQDIYAEGFCGDGFPPWTLEEPPPDPRHDCPNWFLSYVVDPDVRDAFDDFWANERGTMDAFQAMWDVMATRHANRPGVIGFEIINEPGWGTAPLEEWEPNVLTPFYSTMTARIQAIDPDALVFFDATGIDAINASTALERPEGDNLIFAPHFYDSAIFAGGDELSANVLESLRAWDDAGLEWDLPVLLGEFGIQHHHPAAASYARQHYDALDTLQMHAAWWEYSISSDIWNDENLSVVDEEGSEYGILLDEIARPSLAALDGQLTSWSWDADRGVLEAQFEANATGQTELSLPARLFGPETWVGATGEVCVHHADERLLISTPEGGAIHLAVQPTRTSP